MEATKYRIVDQSWAFLLISLLYLTTFIISFTTAQNCADSHQVILPGFLCCNDTLDSESGWRLICSTNGEIPTEPPELAVTAPPAEVTSPSTDPNRFSKAVKTENATLPYLESALTTTESTKSAFPRGDGLTEDGNSLQDPSKKPLPLSTEPSLANDTSVEQHANTESTPAHNDPNAPRPPLEYPFANSIEMLAPAPVTKLPTPSVQNPATESSMPEKSPGFMQKSTRVQSEDRAAFFPETFSLKPEVVVAENRYFPSSAEKTFPAASKKAIFPHAAEKSSPTSSYDKPISAKKHSKIFSAPPRPLFPKTPPTSSAADGIEWTGSPTGATTASPSRSLPTTLPPPLIPSSGENLLTTPVTSTPRTTAMPPINESGESSTQTNSPFAALRTSEATTQEASAITDGPSASSTSSNQVSTSTAQSSIFTTSPTSTTNEGSTEKDNVLSETTSDAANAPAISFSSVGTNSQESTKLPASTSEPETMSEQELRLSSTRFSEPSTTPASTRLRRSADVMDDFLLSGEFKALEAAVEIEYIRAPSGSSLKVVCNTAHPNMPSLFKHLKIDNVINVYFENCAVPQGRLRYSKIFDGNKHNISIFELSRPHGVSNGILAAILFKDISVSIVELHILRSNVAPTPIVSLDENFFQNFSSLKVLRLASNSLLTLPTSVTLLTKLSHLDLFMNRIAEVSSLAFSGLRSLTKLHLGKNPIESFQSKPFVKLKQLTVLELNAINVTEVPGDLFKGLDSLNYLKLEGCQKLKELPEDLFSQTPNLEFLALNEAISLTGLHEQIFSNLTNLKVIGLRQCNLASVPPKLFAAASNSLRSVDLSNNRLRKLPRELFSENAKLEKLILSSNQLSGLDHEFSMLYALRELNLMHNNLTELSETVFENQINLQSLNLAMNKIARIEKNALFHLKKLETLQLADNLLDSFGGSSATFSLASPIREIYLARNRLTLFPNIQFQSLPKLALMDLDGNRITFFAVPYFISLSTKVFVRNNLIEFVSVELAKNSPKIDTKYNTAVGDHEFNLEGNPFKCDCNIYGMIRYMRKESRREVAEFVNADDYRCVETDEPLLKVRMDLLSCEYDDCPKGCKCSLRAHDASLHVSCKQAGLSRVLDLPLNVTHLNLEGNLLTRYPEELRMYRKLREVALDGNNIENIDGLFSGKTPPLLEKISLSGNRLQRLRPQVKNTTFKMTLSGNPWICDCTALDFKRFVRTNVANVLDYSVIQCAVPFLVNGTEVSVMSDIRDEVFCPPDTSAYRFMMVVISITFLIALVLIALYFKNRQLIIAYVYIHFYNVFICFFHEGDLDEEKKFDAFISYSSNDRDVAMAIVQELEKPREDESSENLFRLCIHERDWLPGYNISWNIVNSVQNSRRTILILSQDFLKSLWFEVEFRTAYSQMMEDRINRLIVIIKDEIPPKETLDSDLRYLLSTKTYLQWGEKWFWEKLKYAMPHKGNLSTPIKNKMKASELQKAFPMNVILNRSNIPNCETVLGVEDVIESAREKRNSPNDSTYGSMSDSLRASGHQGHKGAPGSRGPEGHFNRAYDPVSTEDIHAVSSEPETNSEVKPAPRASRKREAPKPNTEKTESPQKTLEAISNEKKLPPVKSARVRPGPLGEAQ